MRGCPSSLINLKKKKKRFDSTKAKVKRFEKGQYVLVKESVRLGTKLSQKYDGPYEIKKSATI